MKIMTEASSNLHRRTSVFLSHTLKLFAYFAGCAFILSSIGYLLLHAVLPEGHVFGGLYRMLAYHEAHPFQYIAIVAIAYGLIATLGVTFGLCFIKRYRTIAIFAIIGLSLIMASIPGGILGTIHDMQAGFFVHGDAFWNAILRGALSGLESGWYVVLLSLPYNIIGLIVGYIITSYGFKIASAECRATKTDFNE